MKEYPPWVRTLIVIGLVVVVLLPLALFVLRNPRVQSVIPQLLRSKIALVQGARYTVQSDVPGYDLVLNDTSFLDYVTAKMKLFDRNAVFAPGGPKEVTAENLRTVSKIQFRLIPKVNQPMFIALNKSKPGAHGSVRGVSEYEIIEDKLVVSVFLDIPGITQGTFLKKNELESSFIQLSLQALNGASVSGKDNISQRLDSALSIDKYLIDGSFSWPFSIIEK